MISGPSHIAHGNQAAQLQNELTAASDWNLHIIEVYRQQDKYVCLPGTGSPKLLHSKTNYRPYKSVCIVYWGGKMGIIRMWNSNILQVQTMWPPIVPHWLLFGVPQRKGCWDSKLKVSKLIISLVPYRYSIKTLRVLTDTQIFKVVHLICHIHLIFKGLFLNKVQEA
jgi:hypothetical protein